jgi:hypothetical protein
MGEILPVDKHITQKQQIGRIRTLFSGKQLKEYKIMDVQDKAPAISEVTVQTTIEVADKFFERKLSLRMYYKGELLIIGDPGGKWGFVWGLSALEYMVQIPIECSM